MWAHGWALSVVSAEPNLDSSLIMSITNPYPAHWLLRYQFNSLGL